MPDTTTTNGAPDAPEARLFALAHDPMAVIGIDGVVQLANPAALELVGRPAEEVVGRPLLDVVDPEDAETVRARFAELAQGGAHGRFRFRVVRRDGARRWLETQTVLDREHGRLLAVGRDVTGLQEADAERLIDAFTGAPLGMAIVDVEGRIERGNHALGRILGVDMAELAGLRLPDVVVGGEEGGPWTPERVAGDDEVGAERETRLRRPDGSEAVVLISATPVRDPRDVPLYYVFQVFDVTARRAEAARLAANEAKLAEAQQIARLGSWEWDLASDHVVWSDELYRIYGVRPGPPARLLRQLPRQGPRGRPRPRGPGHRDGRGRAPRLVAGLPDRPARPGDAHGPRARRGRARRPGRARRSCAARPRTSRRAGASRTRCGPPSSSSAAPSTTRRSAWRSSTSTAAGCA